MSRFTPGDLYNYTPADGWCHHGIAIVLEDGQVFDTYWNGLNTNPFSREYGNLWHEDYLSQLTPESRIGNVSEFAKAYREDCMLYADKDVLYIPIGGGSEQWLLRIGAQPDLQKSLDWKTYKLGESIGKAESAISTARSLFRDLELLRQEEWVKNSPQPVATEDGD